MRRLRAWLLRFAGLFHREKRDRDLAEELESHLQMHIEDNVRVGLAPEEARRQALIRLGGVEQTKENYRDRRGIPVLETLLQDVRYGLRMLRKSPGFTSVVVLTLALGIGANTAIFSVIDAVLLKPLPFKDPGRLVNISEIDLKNPAARQAVSFGNFIDWKDRASTFEQMGAWRFEYFNLAGRDEPEQVQGLRVSPTFLPMLGTAVQIGRIFLADEEQPGQGKVAVLSDAVWSRRFGSDRNLIGQEIAINGESYTVVGILQPTFRFFQVLDHPIDIYVPLTLDLSQVNRESHDISVYARLGPGVSLDQAQSQMDLLYRDLGRQYPQTNQAIGARVELFDRTNADYFRPILLLLLSAVGFVLLIACANIANLMLARATIRQKEMAVRTALGARRARLIRQTLTESLLLGLLGGVAGILLASWGIRILNLLPYTAVNRLHDFELDTKVLAFTFAISVLSGVLFGLTPALQSTAASLKGMLDKTGRSSTGSTHTRQIGSVLAISEVALAVALSSGALLLIRSSLLLQGMPRGLNLNNVLTMQIWLPSAKYSQSRQVATFYRDVLQRVERLPGVESASAINFVPLALANSLAHFTVEGHAPYPPDEVPVARVSVIDPRYFRTMKIPMLSGREFTDNDADEDRSVVIISASMARRFWPGLDAIGRQIRPQIPKQKLFWLPDSKNLPLTIVGVAGDVREDGPILVGRDLPLFYLPYLQNPSPIMHLVVRTSSAPMALAGAVQRQVWAVDKDQPVFDTKTMNDVVAETFGRPRIIADLTGTFAIGAVVLAAVGIYGLLSYLVSQRTHEIGIRMAMGARPRDILQTVIWQGGKIALAGITVGIGTALGLTRLMASFLYGVSPTDLVTFASVAILFMAVALAACYIPTRRAMRVDPMVALRYE